MALTVKSARLIFFMVILITLLVALFIVADRKLQLTSGAKFCGSCHSMKPMTVSYFEDSHAKVAVCADCHLPQDSLINHYFHKVQHGVRDLIQEHLIGTEDINWIEKLANSEQFVYKSGCLKCHVFQEENTEHSASHQLYLQNSTTHCVHCHRVGHKRLRLLLESGNLPSNPDYPKP